MIKRNIIRAMLLSTVLPMAYDSGTPGWKKDADGKLELDGEGNPIYVNATGQEQSVKSTTIADLNSEAKQHREKAETAIANLKKYEKDGKLVDPVAAFKAIDTLKDVDASKLINADKLEELRTQMRNEFTAQLGEKDAALAERDTRINSMLIDGVFKGSEFIAERVAMPRDFFEAAMRNNFKVEDGKVKAFDKAGNPLYSKKNAGELADPNEALELLVEAHPQKDTILKAQQEGGSGNNGGGGARGQGNTLKRAAYDNMAPAEKAAIGVKLGTGEVTLAD